MPLNCFIAPQQSTNSSLSSHLIPIKQRRHVHTSLRSKIASTIYRSWGPSSSSSFQAGRASSSSFSIFWICFSFLSLTWLLLEYSNPCSEQSTGFIEVYCLYWPTRTRSYYTSSTFRVYHRRQPSSHQIVIALITPSPCTALLCEHLPVCTPLLSLFDGPADLFPQQVLRVSWSCPPSSSRQLRCRRRGCSSQRAHKSVNFSTYLAHNAPQTHHNINFGYFIVTDHAGPHATRSAVCQIYC